MPELRDRLGRSLKGARWSAALLALGCAGCASVGTVQGFLFAITEHFKLLPEVALLYPLLESLSYSGVSGTSVAGKNGFFTQLSLGVLVGS